MRLLCFVLCIVNYLVNSARGSRASSNWKTGQSRPRRRRLDPLVDASPSSRTRARHLLHRVHAHLSSAQKKNVGLLHPNKIGNPFGKPAEDPPKTRTWALQLEATPIWICEQESLGENTGNNCRADVEQQQKEVLDQLVLRFPSAVVKEQVRHIVNAIYVEVPFMEDIPPDISGLKSASPEEIYSVAQVDVSVLNSVGATFANEYCLTGAGVRVGILDTGVDYTHAALGGVGTATAYLEAYGSSRTAPENQNRDGFFPTTRVVEGVDYVGESDEDIVEDNDPIDANGHGTFVASAVLAVAPDVELIAAKTCITGPTATCPESALVRGIEFMLDPFRTGTLEQKADVINLSLTSSFNRPFYDRAALALENAAQLGVTCVTAFGNFQNIPYIAGATAGTPNVIAVGATNAPLDNSSPLYMESYSARGPGEANILKPDISAPGTLSLAAVGTGSGYAQARGTSFAAPIVAGAAALLKQYCPVCDPFAIKCILMNSADRDVLYGSETDELRMAPVTRMGSGFLRIDKALKSTLWAYSLEERQPSLSFGVVDAYVDFFFAKTIRIETIDSRARLIRLSHEFRNATKANVVNVTFFPPEIDIPEDCTEAVDVKVQVYVFAANAPQNTMTTSGFQAFDPEPLDQHEFDGHIIISSDIDQEASLPFHLLVRQAAAPVLSRGSGLPFQRGEINETFTIVNQGLGTAQIDAFELIYSDPDDEEAPYGVLEVDSDIRSIGYRTIELGEPGCDYTVEFNFQTWERSTHVGNHMYVAEIYPNGTDGDFVSLTMLSYPFVSQTYVVYNDNSTVCTGFPTDHASNTANTILRACSNNLQLDQGQQQFTVQFRSFAFPLSISSSFLSSRVALTFPKPRLFAPSYDIKPLETLKEFNVQGSISAESFGMQLVTNSFRTSDRTGAASRETETLFLLKRGILLEQEITPDFTVWPGLFNQTGPPCGLTLPLQASCQPQGSQAGESSDSSTGAVLQIPDIRQTPAPNCPPIVVPRMTVPTSEPTVTDPPIFEQTNSPASTLTTSPTLNTQETPGNSQNQPTSSASRAMNMLVCASVFYTALWYCILT